MGRVGSRCQLSSVSGRTSGIQMFRTTSPGTQWVTALWHVDTISYHSAHLIAPISVGAGAEIAILFSRAVVLLMTCFMIKQKDNSAMFLLLLLFLDPTPTRAWVRTDCPEGKQIFSFYNSWYHNLFEKARFCGNRISCVIDHSIKDPVTKVKFWSIILRCQEKAS